MAARWTHVIESVLGGVASLPGTRRLTSSLATARNRRFILLYHRIGRDHSAANEVVPQISPHVFKQHIAAIQDYGDIVPLQQLLESPQINPRVQFALTFDDDHINHVSQALPVLRSMGVTATFFLSGRALNGNTPYWFEILEEAIANLGLRGVSEQLGIRGRHAADVAAVCEPRPMARKVEVLFRSLSSARPMPAADIRTLAAAGMGIGFHTLHHQLLTREDQNDLRVALTEGKSVLEEVIDSPIKLFAYPFGKTNHRVAKGTEEAGYTAAFTNRGFAIKPNSHSYFLGRLDAGERQANDLMRAIALRLTIPASRHRV